MDESDRVKRCHAVSRLMINTLIFMFPMRTMPLFNLLSLSESFVGGVLHRHF